MKQEHADPELFESLLREARQCVIAEEYLTSLDMLSDLIGKYPKRPEPYLDRAEVLHLLGRRKGALRDFSQAIRTADDKHLVYVRRGLAHLEYGSNSRAREDFTTALDLAPGRSPFRSLIYRYRATAHLRAGDIFYARLDVDQALRLDRTFALTWRVRGQVRLRQWDLKGALVDYSQAIRLASQSAPLYFERAHVHERNGNPLSALEDLKKACLLDPCSVEFHAEHARLSSCVLNRLRAAS